MAQGQTTRGKTTRALAVAFGVAVAATLASSANATFTFTLASNPQANEENILFDQPNQGLEIIGQTNQSNAPVHFTSTQQLYQNSQGQADIMGAGNAQDSALTNLSFTTLPVYGFGDFIMNLQNAFTSFTGVAGHTITATITVYDQNSVTHAYTFDNAGNGLGNGSNFLTIVADGGDYMTKIDVQMNDQDFFQEFKQPRISSVSQIGDGVCAVIDIPEPASLALVSLGVTGLGFFVRRRRS